MNRRNPDPTEQEGGDLWPLVLSSVWSRERKRKKSPPSLFLITDLDFHEFGAWIYTTTAAGRKRWNVSLNWFQLGDTPRHLTEANSNFLWKKILLNGASMNSYMLSYKENDFFFLLHRASLLWEVGMRADNLSGLPGFRWLTDLVCFLHPERGTWVGGRVGRKNVWKDRSQVWSATEPLLCILPEGRNLVSRSLSKPCLFQTLRAQALWAHWWLPEMAVPRCCPLVHTANMPPASCGTFGTLVSGKCTVLTKNATLGEICYILFTKK